MTRDAWYQMMRPIRFSNVCWPGINFEIGVHDGTGGDWGHGGRLYLRFEPTGADMQVSVADREDEFCSEDCEYLEIVFGGDGEIAQMQQVLSIIAHFANIGTDEGSVDPVGCYENLTTIDKKLL